MLLMSLSLAAALAAFAAQSLELTKAIHVQEALVAQRPTDATAQNDLGNLLVLDGRLAAAEAAYRRAVELDGAILSAHFNLALLLEQRGESREGLKPFRRGGRRGPFGPPAARGAPILLPRAPTRSPHASLASWWGPTPRRRREMRGWSK